MFTNKKTKIFIKKMELILLFMDHTKNLNNEHVIVQISTILWHSTPKKNKIDIYEDQGLSNGIKSLDFARLF